MTEQIDRLKAALAGRYEIESQIGEGGMATVYLAHDVRHERQVALKVLRPDLAAALGPERFTREIRIAAQLQHPHVLPLHDSGEADGFLYYVMPYVRGESLRDRLTRSGELPIADAVKIIREIVDALAHAHEHGVVHRDLKPDNVMLSKRHALVMDFGVAKAVSEATGREQLTTAGVALGTPAYMAPEQATADPHTDHRADIYAVGVVAYELLTGSPPFSGPNAQAILAAHVMQEPDPVTAQRASVPAPLADLVMRCLAKKPADRWQSAEEMLTVLEGLTTTSGGMTPAQTRPVAAFRGRNRNAALIAAAIVGAGLVAAAGFLLGGSDGGSDVPAPVDRQVTFRGDVKSVALARDGRTIAYQAEEGRSLIVQDLEGGGSNTLVQLEDPTMGMNEPYWGPDDSRVYFNLFDMQGRSDVIASVPRLGGPLRTEADLLPLRRPNAFFRGFTAAGEYVITFGSWIYVGTAPETLRWVTEDSLAGDGAVLRVGAGGDMLVSVLPSPDGRWIAYGMFGEATLLTGGLISRDGTQKTVLTEDESGFLPIALGWSAGGEAAYYPVRVGQGGNIVRVPIDLAEGVPSGGPTVVYRMGSDWGLPQVASEGTLFYIGGSSSSNLKAIELTGAPRAAEYSTSMLTSGTAMNFSSALTPDGEMVIFERYTGAIGRDIYRRPTRGGAERLVTHRSGYGIVTLPAISRDGSHLAFFELNEEERAMLVVLDISTGRGTELPVAEGQLSLGWSPDGQQIATTGLAQDRLTLVNPRDSSEVTIALECDTTCSFGGAPPVYSPDGGRVVLAGEAGLWIATLPDGQAVRITEGTDRSLTWTEDWIYFTREEAAESGKRYPVIYRIAPEGGTPQLYTRLPEDCHTRELSLSLDASMAVCAVFDERPDVHIVENFDAGAR